MSHEWNLSYTSGKLNRSLYCDCLRAIPADDIISVPSTLRDKQLFTVDMIEALEVLDMKTPCEASHRLSAVSSYTHDGQYGTCLFIGTQRAGRRCGLDGYGPGTRTDGRAECTCTSIVSCPPSSIDMYGGR
jgi:hypothetical protein